MLKKIVLVMPIALVLPFVLTACSKPAKSGASTQDTPSTTAQAAQAPAPKSCTEPEYRQLDFWLGAWDLEWDQADGSKGTGTNIITKSPYGDCVITENFDGAPSMKFKGMSVSTWHKPLKTWRQTWVDDQGGYFALSGGPNDDGTFALTTTRLNDKGPYQRMIWTNIQQDSMTWHWQGHKPGETEWKDLWVIRYRRKTAQ